MASSAEGLSRMGGRILHPNRFFSALFPAVAGITGTAPYGPLRKRRWATSVQRHPSQGTPEVAFRRPDQDRSARVRQVWPGGDAI